MNKLLSTFFFGYLSFKYRRLLRTPIILFCFTLLVVGLYEGLEKSGPDYSLIRDIYNKYSFYQGMNGKYYTFQESKQLWGDSVDSYLEDGTLKVVNMSFDVFIKSLKSRDDLYPSLVNSLNDDNYFNQSWKIDSYDLKYYKFKLIDLSVRFRLFIENLIIVLFVLGSVFVISFLVEPFVLDRKNQKVKQDTLEKSTVLNPESKGKVESLLGEIQEFHSEQKSEKTDSKLEKENKTKKGIRKYFSFDSEYLNGGTYLMRFLIGIFTSWIFGLGILLVLTTVYKRSKSLGLSRKISIFNCVLIPLLLFISYYVSFVESRYIFLSDSEFYKLVLLRLLLGLPHFILLFKNGIRTKKGDLRIRQN